jgi:hypothetical protein
MASPDSSYTGYIQSASPEVLRVLNAECSESLASTFQLQPSPSASKIAVAMAEMEGGKYSDDEKWQEIVKAAQPVGLTGQYAGPQWEHADPKHRVGELLMAAWNIYRQKGGQAGEKSPGFFAWLDAIPELQRIMMLSDAIKSLGTKVLGTPQEQAAFLKYANAPDPDYKVVTHSVGGAKFKQPVIVPRADTRPNLKPSVVKAFVKGVAYLDQISKPDYKVSFEHGVAFYRGKPLDTNPMSTVFSGSGFAIWVIDEAGDMYAGNHVFGQMHHSSFLSGGLVAAAGELRAVNGRLQFLSGKSGHYQPSLAQLQWAIRVLQFRLVNTYQLRVLVFRDADPPWLLVRAHELLSYPGNYKAWGRMTYVEKQQFRAEFGLI